MSTPNFTVRDKETDKEYWISRSVVVIPFTFMFDDGGNLYTLVERRGESVSHTGEWCCPCGYLDWNETLEQACVREIFEETGVEIDVNNVHFISYNADPDESRQNIGMRFCCFADNGTTLDKTKIMTKDEVDDVEWLKIGSIHSPGYNYRPTLIIDKDSLNSKKWAFGHNYLLMEVLEDYYKNKVSVF